MTGRLAASSSSLATRSCRERAGSEGAEEGAILDREGSEGAVEGALLATQEQERSRRSRGDMVRGPGVRG